MKNHEGKWAIACGPEEYDIWKRDPISLLQLIGGDLWIVKML